MPRGQATRADTEPDADETTTGGIDDPDPVRRYTVTGDAIENALGPLSWDAENAFIPIPDNEMWGSSDEQRDMVRDVLLGRDRSHDSRIEAYLLENRPVLRANQIKLELLAWAGVSIIAVVALTHRTDQAFGGVRTADGHLVTEAVHAHGAIWMRHAHLAEDLQWWRTALRISRSRFDLPDTVLNGIVGERLSAVVSHPVLDRYDLRILGADVVDDGDAIGLRIEDGTCIRTCTMERLIEIWREAGTA